VYIKGRGGIWVTTAWPGCPKKRFGQEPYGERSGGLGSRAVRASNRTGERSFRLGCGRGQYITFQSLSAVPGTGGPV